eukprot:CAMPEP_0194349538 /NCGR_PEP_ID=MMETSP0171-20130528/107146_1 /TAXON_ID=218684 /ORGANISM="Corethron pennatum, Strain L29A3" /LENGTH=518 /DNA_ID=CAMNT_0039117003 /DNA_START=64 /DNA_END=1620 /DNA_ORIENTATION=-
MYRRLPLPVLAAAAAFARFPLPAAGFCPSRPRPPLAPVSTSALPSTEEETEVFGAKFFGGAAEKESLFDDEARAAEERGADLLRVRAAGRTSDGGGAAVAERQRVGVERKEAVYEDAGGYRIYNRFADVENFPDARSRAMGRGLQASVEYALRGAEEEEGEAVPAPPAMYAAAVAWESPLRKNHADPLSELAASVPFYRSTVRLAVLSCAAVGPAAYAVRWTLSGVWPNPWEGSLTFTGVSTLAVDTAGRIVAQTDTLDDVRDFQFSVYDQIGPKFWDIYHLLMTPPAQRLPKIPLDAPLFANYAVYEIPPHASLCATLPDPGRNKRATQTLPMHAFAAYIRTAGNPAQSYETTGPITIAIAKKPNIITWSVPVPPSVYRAARVPLGETEVATDAPGTLERNAYTGDSEATLDDEGRTLTYAVAPRRRVATVPFAGTPQDDAVAEVRRKLYESVVKDGKYAVKIGEDGRPLFFYRQNNAVACWTDDGLGMGVYAWIPRIVKCHEVGLELECDEGGGGP